MDCPSHEAGAVARGYPRAYGPGRSPQQ